MPIIRGKEFTLRLHLPPGAEEVTILNVELKSCVNPVRDFSVDRTKQGAGVCPGCEVEIGPSAFEVTPLEERHRTLPSIDGVDVG